MDENNSIRRFVLPVLAGWRLTQLFAEEDSSWYRIECPRKKLDIGYLGRLRNCFYCLNLWFSLPLAIWLSSGWIGLLLQWQALAGAAYPWDRSRRKQSANNPEVHALEGDTG
jgi:hypothetical protein